MQVTIKKENVKRLASLTALGAGALAAGASSAEAAILSFDVGITVGYSAGPTVPFLLVDLPGAADFMLETSGSGSTAHVHIVPVGFPSTNPGAFVLQTPGPELQAFSAGATWGAGSGFFLGVPGRHNNLPATNFAGDDKYFLFRFLDTTVNVNELRYGWGELEVTFPAGFPDVKLVRWAYEDSGELIEAGDVGGRAAVPEPSALALTGLGALFLGASGIRRWRAARQS